MSKKSRDIYIKEINDLRNKIIAFMILSFVAMFSMSFGFFSQSQTETTYILLGTVGLILLVVSLGIILYLDNKRKKLIDQIRQLRKSPK